MRFLLTGGCVKGANYTNKKRYRSLQMGYARFTFFSAFRVTIHFLVCAAILTYQNNASKQAANLRVVV